MRHGDNPDCPFARTWGLSNAGKSNTTVDIESSTQLPQKERSGDVCYLPPPCQTIHLRPGAHLLSRSLAKLKNVLDVIHQPKAGHFLVFAKYCHRCYRSLCLETPVRNVHGAGMCRPSSRGCLLTKNHVPPTCRACWTTFVCPAIPSLRYSSP